MSAKIRKGDTVELISGSREEIGMRGEVIRVLAEEDRVVVQGLNMRKKHQRQAATAGRRNLNPGIIEFEAPVHVSNVMLVCPKCDKPRRVGLDRSSGSVQRICKKCGAEI